MPGFTFEHGPLQLEMAAASQAALNVRDVNGDGSRLSFEGGKIIVDFNLRHILEERGAKLGYRILEDGEEVFAATGYPSRSYRSGVRRSGFDPIVYSF